MLGAEFQTRGSSEGFPRQCLRPGSDLQDCACRVERIKRQDRCLPASSVNLKQEWAGIVAVWPELPLRVCMAASRFHDRYQEAPQQARVAQGTRRLVRSPSSLQPLQLPRPERPSLLISPKIPHPCSHTLSEVQSRTRRNGLFKRSQTAQGAGFYAVFASHGEMTVFSKRETHPTCTMMPRWLVARRTPVSHATRSTHKNLLELLKGAWSTY